MARLDLSAEFERFDDAIRLNPKQVDRMNSVYSTIKGFLLKRFDLAEGDVFIQGSYANGTAIEPVDGGEYDVDIVGITVQTDGVSADSALDALEVAFRDDGRFAPRIVPRPPCLRLEYAEDEVGKFHVDVVPVRPGDSAPLDAPRRNAGWHKTAPREYTNWCRLKGDDYAKTVRAMKRWRDERQSVRDAIKSIVLQVLVADVMPPLADDAQRLTETFRALDQYLSRHATPPVVPNPVLTSENLARRWEQDSYEDFKEQVTEAVELANEASSNAAKGDAIGAAMAWQKLLGDDFPLPTTNKFGIRVADFAHAQSPEEMGWTMAIDRNYSVSVSAMQFRGKKQRNPRPLSSDGHLVFAPGLLRFRAETSGPGRTETWWQVANTGAHARELNGLRGGIFRGQSIQQHIASDDPNENWEPTKYTGAHLVRAMLVQDQKVVAMSDWFIVNIFSNLRRHFSA